MPKKKLSNHSSTILPNNFSLFMRLSIYGSSDILDSFSNLDVLSFRIKTQWFDWCNSAGCEYIFLFFIWFHRFCFFGRFSFFHRFFHKNWFCCHLRNINDRMILLVLNLSAFLFVLSFLNVIKIQIISISRLLFENISHVTLFHWNVTFRTLITHFFYKFMIILIRIIKL